MQFGGKFPLQEKKKKTHVNFTLWNTETNKKQRNSFLTPIVSFARYTWLLERPNCRLRKTVYIPTTTSRFRLGEATGGACGIDTGGYGTAACGFSSAAETAFSYKKYYVWKRNTEETLNNKPFVFDSFQPQLYLVPPFEAFQPQLYLVSAFEAFQPQCEAFQPPFEA